MQFFQPTLFYFLFILKEYKPEKAKTKLALHLVTGFAMSITLQGTTPSFRIIIALNIGLVRYPIFVDYSEKNNGTKNLVLS